MTVETLKGLYLLETLDTPVPESVNNYFKSIATGTGPFGVPTVMDMIGIAAGAEVSTALYQATSILGATDLSGLKAVYDNMLSCVQGAFGPSTGPVVIPSGPGAGTYASGDLAFTNGLIPAAEAAIAAIIASNPDATNSLNNLFDQICNRILSEAMFQSKAGINYDNQTSPGQSAVYSFVSSLSTVGAYSTPGGQAQYLLQVADITTQAGQAIVGSIREGKNQLVLNEAGIPIDSFNVSANYPGDPNTPGTAKVVAVVIAPTISTSALNQPPAVPAPVGYQTPSNPTSTSYTVAEAVQVAQTPPENPPAPVGPAVPTKVSIIDVYEQSPTSQQPGSSTTTLLQLQPFWLRIKAQPSDGNTWITVKNDTSGESASFVPGINLNSEEGMMIRIPGWLIKNTGIITLSVLANDSSAADSVVLNVVVNNYPKTTTVTQDSWFQQENVTVAGNTVTVTFRGPPDTWFAWGTSWSNYGTPWPTGDGTFDANGYAVYSGLSSPPVNNNNQVWIRYLSGEVVYTSFTTLPA